MMTINALRVAVGPVGPSSLEEAWTRFERERGFELWLEGRGLGDLYR